MNKLEYEKIKNYSYSQYCEYLQKKYGIGKYPYFTTGWSRNKSAARTSEGLVIHHKFEDHAIMLGEPKFAIMNPYEWQLPENLIYCDYLEHLLLHIMICEHPAPDHNDREAVGIGGVINFIAPELNDLYSGWVTKQAWRAECHKRVINDKDVYLELLKRFKHNCNKYPLYTDRCLYTSFNAAFGLWDAKKNFPLFDEIKKL